MAVKSFGEIQRIKDKRVWHITAIEPHVAIKLKSIFPRVPQWARPPISLPDSAEICSDLYWFFQRYPFCMSTEDEKYLKKTDRMFSRFKSEAEEILKPGYVPSKRSFKDGQMLRDYEAAACEVIAKVKRTLLGDDVGLGKTYTAIGAMFSDNALPAAVVVETHMPSQWCEKLDEFSDLRVHVIRKSLPYDLPSADVYIFKYGSIAGWIDYFSRGVFRSAIFDEVQQLRNGTATAKGKSAKMLSDCAEYSFGLSATPIYNYGDEIFSVLDIIKDGCLGTRDAFLREWGGAAVGNRGCLVKNPQALGTYLRENFLMIRRTRKEVGKELPPVNTIVQNVGIDEQAIKTADELARILAVKASTGSFLERGRAVRDLDMMMRQATGIAKAKCVAEYVRIILESGEPVLLGGWHRAVYDIWLRELAEFNPVMYTGTEDERQKEASKQKFMSGESNLMILSLRSGAGMDGIQKRCSIAVFGELDWSKQVHHQFVGRLDREGQGNGVMAVYLISEQGSDPVIVEMLGVKASQSHGILNPEIEQMQVHSDESKMQKLVAKYLSSPQKGKGDLVEQSVEAGCQGATILAVA